MIKRLIRQNRPFLLITLVLYLLFSSILYVSFNQIYQREARLQHQLEDAQLTAAELSILAFFADSERDIRFLRSLPAVKNYIDSDFMPSVFENEVRETIYRFALTHNQYSRLRIIDSSGLEVSAAVNRQGEAPYMVPGGELRDESRRQYFVKLMEPGSEGIHISPIDMYDGIEDPESFHAPLARIGVPLFKGEAEKAGVLILDVNIAQWFKLLPGEIFVQTEEGNIISIGPDGTLDFRQSGYVFPESSGMLEVSDTETIHYSSVEVPPGKELVLGIQHEHPLLQLMFRRLMLATVMLMVLFLGLMFFIGYINISRARELISAEQAIIFSLAGLAEDRNPETGEHLERTKKYASALAKQLAKNPKFRGIISRDFIENLNDAAPLHDIGKVGIPDSVLLKEGKLTDEEFDEMKKHVSLGTEIIRKTIEKFKLRQTFLFMSQNISAYHHEKYNGRGYPEGLKGDDIPVEARIFALCDAYDAIRSKRPYKAPLTHEDAVERIKSGSGRHFDPDIVKAFLECEHRFALIHDSFEERKTGSGGIR